MAGETLATRYALALFGVASEHSIVDEVREDLFAFSAILKDKVASLLFSHPRVTKERRKSIVDKLSAGYKVISVDFLKLLIDKGRESELHAITEAFAKLSQVAKGEIHALVHSSTPLTDDEVKSLKIKLGEPDKVVLDLRLEPRLLGGLTVQVGHVVYDGSVMARLKTLKTQLAKVEVRIAEVKDIAP